jgi:hypothetical protein
VLGVAAAVAILAGVRTVAACDASACPSVLSAEPRVVDVGDGPAAVALFVAGASGIDTVLLEPGDIPLPFVIRGPGEVDLTVPAGAATGERWFIVEGPSGASVADPPPLLQIVRHIVGAPAAASMPEALAAAPTIAPEPTAVPAGGAGAAVGDAGTPAAAAGGLGPALVGMVAVPAIWAAVHCSTVGLRHLRRSRRSRRHRPATAPPDDEIARRLSWL